MNCICGCKEGTSFTLNSVDVIACANCGIHRISRVLFSDYEQYKTFYRNEYPPNKVDYIAKDYLHDRRLAKMRCDDYGVVKGLRLLDVGSGSGAFVDECRDRGIEGYGCELGEYHYRKTDKYIYKGALQDIYFPTDYFDVVTCHDVLEHAIDPMLFLREVFRIIKQQGRFIIDFPDFFSNQGTHHWKFPEHIWYFSINQLEWLLREVGFIIEEMEQPIDSKFVFHLKKPIQSRPKILVPPGMGDSYWSVVRLRAFLRRERLGLPDIYVASPKESRFNGHKRAFPFLEMFPFLHATDITVHAKQTTETKALWQEAYGEKGRTIFKDVLGCDYFISYNGHLKYGASLEEVDSDLECEWNPPMFISLEQMEFERKCKEQYKKYIVLYFPLRGTYTHWTAQFPIKDIVQSVNMIVQTTGLIPIFTGAVWDKEQDTDLRYIINHVSGAIDLTGQTTVQQLFGLMKGSELVIGYPSGLTIMSSALGKKTLIIWNDYYDKGFWWNACPPSVKRKTYFILSTNKLTPIKLAMRVMRILGDTVVTKLTEIQKSSSLFTPVIDVVEKIEKPISTLNKLRWIKRGGGSFRMGDGRIIKPNQKFLAALEEIPAGFRDVVVQI